MEDLREGQVSANGHRGENKTLLRSPHLSQVSHPQSPSEVLTATEKREEFFALAARIFGVERASIDGATAYESIPGWDSVNHLRLVMEVERAFGVKYPLERIPSLMTLNDFFA